MKKETIKYLACPDCKGELQLHIFEIRPVILFGEKREEIWEGILVCKRCKRWFPIIKGIPWLYPKELRRRDVEKTFINKHRDKKIISEILLREKEI